MMDKQTQAIEVHLVTFGKRKRLADKAAHALPQSVVPSLYMVGLAALLANSFMLLIRQHFLIRLPKVAVEGSAAVTGRNRLPQQATGFLAAVANHKGHHLTSAATQRDPHPLLVFAPVNK